MKKKKYIPFKKAYNFIQRSVMAEMLLQGKVEEVKRSFSACNVEFTEEIAKEIVSQYGKTNK